VTEASSIISPETVKLRRLEDGEGDWNFVRSAYLRSYWEGGVRREERVIRTLPKGLFGRNQVRYLKDNLLGSPGRWMFWHIFAEGQKQIRDRFLEKSEVWLACSPDDPWFLMGFVVGERPASALVLHYVYVKKHFRRMGLATKMVKAMADGRGKIVATHRTVGWDGLAPSLEKGGDIVEFNPYLMIS